MANFEYSYADGYNGRVLSQDRANGFYSTVSYRITQKLHVLARYDQFDPNMDIGDDMRREYTAGINYFIKGQALRLILNYVSARMKGNRTATELFSAPRFCSKLFNLLHLQGVDIFEKIIKIIMT